MKSAQSNPSEKDPDKASPPSESLGPPRIIRDASGKVIKQYPAHVRHHGTDAEPKLSPEE